MCSVAFGAEMAAAHAVSFLPVWNGKGFLGKALAGVEIFMVALFHCGLEFVGSDSSGSACNVFINSDVKSLL